jgi:hypothetical protein
MLYAEGAKAGVKCRVALLGDGCVAVLGDVEDGNEEVEEMLVASAGSTLKQNETIVGWMDGMDAGTM